MNWVGEWVVDGEHADSDFEERIALEADGIRLDLYLTGVFPEMSRSRLKNALTRAIVNGREAKLASPIFRGDKLEIAFEELDATSIEPEDIPLDILYEDENLWVISKNRGLVVHPGAGNRSGTLAAALLFRAQNLAETTDALRPGIVHRLDKDTSGVMVAAKNREALEWLSARFRNRETRKYYIAICRVRDNRLLAGQLSLLQAGVDVESEILRDRSNRTKFRSLPLGSGGKYASSRVELLGLSQGEASNRNQQQQNCALFRVQIYTGRTHQVRLHLAGLGFPVLGDPLYAGRAASAASMLLHSHRLAIQLPGQKDESRFEAPLPLDMQEAIANLGISAL